MGAPPRKARAPGAICDNLGQSVEASQRVGVQTRRVAFSRAGGLEDAFSQMGTNTLRVARRRQHRANFVKDRLRKCNKIGVMNCVGLRHLLLRALDLSCGVVWHGDVRVNNYFEALKQKLPRGDTVPPRVLRERQRNQACRS
jgi:hypothetical protein